MKKSHKTLTVDECKIQASILLKSLRSEDKMTADKAAKRFQILPEFKSLSIEEIGQTQVKRKHALAAIAMEKGFESWSDLKCQVPFIRGGFLNQWFANYAEAKSYQKLKGGFLLPYKKQYFICDEDYINNLGFNSNDNDWQLIGYDWVNPANQPAWQRLYTKWITIQESNGHK